MALATGLNWAAVRAAVAWATLIPATWGIATMSAVCAWVPGLPKSSGGKPAEASSMISFQVGAATVAPKIGPP